nr:hypothetical protein [Methylosinus sp. PW1]
MTEDEVQLCSIEGLALVRACGDLDIDAACDGRIDPARSLRRREQRRDLADAFVHGRRLQARREKVVAEGDDVRTRDLAYVAHASALLKIIDRKLFLVGSMPGRFLVGLLTIALPLLETVAMSMPSEMARCSRSCSAAFRHLPLMVSGSGASSIWPPSRSKKTARYSSSACRHAPMKRSK